MKKCPTCGQPIDPLKAQFSGQRHRYPELQSVGLAHIWIGPGFNDFADRIVAGAIKFLKKHDLPHERGDAINAIRNKIRQQDWGWLEQRWDEGKVATPAGRAVPPAPLGKGGKQPKTLAEMGPEERAAAMAAIRQAREGL